MSQNIFPYALINESKIKDILDQYSALSGKKFERYVKSMVENIVGKENVVAPVEKITIGFDVVRLDRVECGEIDLMVLDGTKKILHLFEVKSMAKKAGYKKLLTELDRFYEKKESFFNKLLTKEKYVKENLQFFLEKFGKSIKGNNDYRLKKAFIVRNNHLSMYVKSDIRILLVNGIEDYLNETI